MSLVVDTPVRQLLPRWWLYFMSVVLTVFGIALLVYAYELPGIQGYLSGPGVLFLYTATILLFVALFIRNEVILRAVVGAIGFLYFAWGTVFLFLGPSYYFARLQYTVTLMGVFLILVGSMGLASLLIPAFWLYPRPQAR